MMFKRKCLWVIPAIVALVAVAGMFTGIFAASGLMPVADRSQDTPAPSPPTNPPPSSPSEAKEPSPTIAIITGQGTTMIPAPSPPSSPPPSSRSEQKPSLPITKIITGVGEPEFTGGQLQILLYLDFLHCDGYYVWGHGHQIVYDAANPGQYVDADKLTTCAIIWYWNGSRWVNVGEDPETCYDCHYLGSDPEGRMPGSGWYVINCRYTGKAAPGWSPSTWDETLEQDPVWFEYVQMAKSTSYRH